MARWVHTLGYRGHITMKTRAYSTTMGALRAQRTEWRALQTENEDGDGEPTEPHAPGIGWRFVQVGHHNDRERLLAHTADVKARTARLVGREESTCGGWRR